MSEYTYKTGDRVTTIKEVDASTSARKITIPAGTVGLVIQGLNEVYLRSYARRGWTAVKGRYQLALVRWEDYDAQAWLRYEEISLTD